ncbi:hypothetical protein [Pontibacter populi]|uniref:STAS/SEC14 domain-containing protein n=1 Tax=Pontibacter populi TaxID=890055 RepID=A0ABV1RXV3_9BACT
MVLDYDAATDILYATCPDMKQEEMLHIYAAFAVMVKTLKEKNIPYLILDTSSSQLDMHQEDYNTILALLSTDLAVTGLQKLARLVSPDEKREGIVRQFLKELDAHQSLPYVVESFTSKEAAVTWLKEIK